MAHKNVYDTRNIYIAVVVVDGKIYAIDKSNGILECYNPATNKWTTLNPQPVPGVSTAFAFQDKIYCISNNRLINDDALAGGVIDIYDPATDSWSTNLSISEPDIYRRYIKAQVIDDKVFILMRMGIYLEHPNTYDKNTIMTTCYLWYLYMYDPIEDSWTEKAKIPFFSPNHVSDIVFVTVDDKLLVFGTFYTNPTHTLVNNKSESKILSYSPETDKWTQIDTSANAFSYVVGVTSGLYAPQKIYFFRITECTDVYDPVDNTWLTAEPIPVAMRKSCSVWWLMMFST